MPSESQGSVIHLPDYTDGNPYLDNLTGGLREAGQDAAVIDDSESYLFSIVRSARELGVELVHVHWLEAFYRGDGLLETAVKSLLFPFELLLVALLDIRVVWTVHNTTPHDVRFPRIYRLLGHVFARLSDRIIVHGDSAIEDVVSAYQLPASERSKFAVVPHGNYLGAYPDEVSQTEARDELEIGDDQTVFLYFGRVRPYKGVHDLLTAFRNLDEEDAQVLVVGQPESDRYDQRIRWLADGDDRVRYIAEFIPDEEVQLYFNAADAVVLPFTDVLSSGSALLALSFGCPIVIPERGCLADLTEGSIQYSPKYGVSSGLSQALEADLDELSEEALEYAKSVNWQKVGEETAEVYATVRRD